MIRIAGIILVLVWSIPAWADGGDDLLDRARAQWKGGKFAEAARSYQRLIDKHAKHRWVTGGHAAFWLWACHGRAGDRPAAIQALRRFLKQYPKHSSVDYARRWLKRYTAQSNKPAADTGWFIFPAGKRAGLPRAGGGHVVLTNLADDDPYHAAARKLARLRKAKILRFARLTDLTQKLRQLGPTYATFVLRPETIDINFHYRVLAWAAALDDDPFVDLAYGFLTGQTAADLSAWIDRIAAAQERPLPRKLLEFGPSSIDQFRPNSEPWIKGFETATLHHKGLDRIKARATDLRGCGILRYWGHGAPERIVDSLRAADLKKLELGPAIVFGGACYTGVVRRSYDRSLGKAKVQGRDLEPEDSFCLQLLKQVKAFFGALDPDHGITAMQEFERLMTTGDSLGRAVKHGYDLLVLSGRGKLPLHPYVDGAVRKRLPVEQIMLRGAAARVLFGDPSMRPLKRAAASPVVRAFWGREHRTLILRPANDDIRGSFTNIFRSGLGGVRGMNGKLHCAVVLPDGWNRRPVSVSAKGRRGKIVTGFPTTAIESWGGRRYLHVQVDIPRGKQREAGFELRLTFDDGPLGAAREAARWLLAASRASKDGERRRWPEYGGEKRCGQDLYSGAAGVLLDLLALHRATRDPKLLEAIDQGARYLMATSDVTEQGRSWKITFERRGQTYERRTPGLYTGAAGIGWALLTLGRELDRPAYRKAARQAADWILATAKRTETGWHWDSAGYDIISGGAGIGLFLLELHVATRHAPYLEAAVKAADHLISVGRPADGGKTLQWPSSTAMKGRIYPNFSHGTAGIAYYLARVHQATSKPRFLAAARKGARWLIDHAVADGAGCKWYHHAPKATKRYLAGWCHGPAGTGYLFLLLHRITGEKRYLETAEKGAAWIADRGFEKFYSPSLCCGATGIGQYYLALHRRTGKRQYLDHAGKVGRALLRLAQRDGKGLRWTNYPVKDEQGKIYHGTSHMVGTAGSMGFLVRLHAAQSGGESRVVTPDRR